MGNCLQQQQNQPKNISKIDSDSVRSLTRFGSITSLLGRSQNSNNNDTDNPLETDDFDIINDEKENANNNNNKNENENDSSSSPTVSNISPLPSKPINNDLTDINNMKNIVNNL
eukprot:37869_1